MLLVRKTLTSILLEVTNERIQEISSETLSKYRKKGRLQKYSLTINFSLIIRERKLLKISIKFKKRNFFKKMCDKSVDVHAVMIMYIIFSLIDSLMVE